MLVVKVFTYVYRKRENERFRNTMLMVWDGKCLKKYDLDGVSWDCAIAKLCYLYFLISLIFFTVIGLVGSNYDVLFYIAKSIFQE